jgi:hypothetical protein
MRRTKNEIEEIHLGIGILGNDIRIRNKVSIATEPVNKEKMGWNTWIQDSLESQRAFQPKTSSSPSEFIASSASSERLSHEQYIFHVSFN